MRQTQLQVLNNQSKLLKIVAALPSLQCQITQHSVSDRPVDDLIVDRIFERVFATTPKVSVLISLDPGRMTPTLSAILAGLMKQRLPVDDFEVIVVNPGDSTDFASDMNSLVSKPDFRLQMRVLSSAPGGRARAHNIASRLARGQVIAFLADDFVPPETFLDAHLKFHQTNSQRGAVGVAAGVFPQALRDIEFRRWMEDSGLIWGIAPSAFRCALPQDFFYIGNSSMKKELIEEVGYFDEDFSHNAWDDYEMSRRLAKIGANSMFVDGAECVHFHPLTLRERCFTMKLAGSAACIFDCKYSGVKEWHADLALTAAQHRWKALLGMGAYLVSGDRKLQHRYWTKLLSANFVEGYLDKLKTLIEL